MSSIKQAAEEMLLQTIIPFWKGLRDEENGGFYGYMDFDLKLDKKAEKGCILNSRILWFFSEAAMLTGRADLAEDARHAYQFFLKNCYDEANGGVYWSCDYTGKPQDTTKHTYNQGFAIYALSAYYRLTKDPVALTYAKKIFHLIEQHCTDSEGYLEAFTIDWKPESNEKLSENGVMAAKTMNTLLHVFEGYAGLYQASRDPEVEKALRRILDIYEHKIYSPELHRQLVFFDQHYNSIIDLYSYGHDIESSWLIDWGCDLLGDAALSKRIHAINSDLAAHIYKEAYIDHSVVNECDRGKVNTTRVWWVQAESVLGFVNEYNKSGDAKYRDAAADFYHIDVDLCAFDLVLAGDFCLGGDNAGIRNGVGIKVDIAFQNLDPYCTILQCLLDGDVLRPCHLRCDLILTVFVLKLFLEAAVNSLVKIVPRGNIRRVFIAHGFKEFLLAAVVFGEPDGIEVKSPQGRGGLVIGVEGLYIALGHGGRIVAAQEDHDHSDDHRKGGCADQNKFQRGFLGGGDLRFPGGSGFFCFFWGGDDLRIADGDVLGRGSGEVVVLHLFLLLILNYVCSL